MSRILSLGPPITVKATQKEGVDELFSRSGEEALVVEKEGRFLGLLSRLVWEKARLYRLSLTPEELVFEIPEFQDAEPEEIFLYLKNPLERVFWKGSLLSLREFWAFFPERSFKGRRLSLKPPLSLLRERVLKLARDLKTGVFLVGGAVRDLLLEKEVFDIDLVITSNCQAFAQALSESLEAPLVKSSLFGTFKLSWQGLEIDLAQARWEYYEAPARLPKVAPGSLSWDLFRRDFTINTLALELEELTLIDFYGGERDLAGSRLEVLHTMSLVDDPTRIFRAARYATRFNLKPTRNFERALALAKKFRALSLLSPARLKNELKRILMEKDPWAVFGWLSEAGLLGDIGLEKENLRSLKELLKDPSYSALKDEEKLEAVLLVLTPPEDLARFGISPQRSKNLLSFLKILVSRKDLLHPSRPLSEKVFFLEKAPLSALLAFKALFPEFRREIDLALSARRARPHLNGDDLLRLGVSPGPLVGEMLKRLRAAKIDGLLKDREDEISFLKKEYPHVFSS